MEWSYSKLRLVSKDDEDIDVIIKIGYETADGLFVGVSLNSRVFLWTGGGWRRRESSKGLEG